MIGLILCDRTDGVRKDLVALLHRSFCRKLVPHSRLTLPCKSSCKIVKGLCLGKFHTVSSLTQPHYAQQMRALYANHIQKITGTSPAFQDAPVSNVLSGSLWFGQTLAPPSFIGFFGLRVSVLPIAGACFSDCRCLFFRLQVSVFQITGACFSDCGAYSFKGSPNISVS